MSLFALIAAILAQKIHPLPLADPAAEWIRRYVDVIEHYFNAGERRFGVAAWLVLVLSILLPLAVAAHFLADITPLLAWLLGAAVLYFAIRFRAVLMHYSAVARALQVRDLDGARDRLALCLGRPVLQYDATQVAKTAIEWAFLECYRGLFAVLFWFVVLPGPGGALVYRAALIAAQRWHRDSESSDHRFGWFAGRMFELMDWIPQRLTAVSFAIVGDFEDALYCWRSQAAAWGNAEEGIVLASAAGALGARLGDPLTEVDGARYRPELGIGEHADADYMQSAEGLIWRAVVLWAFGLLVIAAFRVLV
jgi:adenosylcobinamide-phosphate synthase